MGIFISLCMLVNLGTIKMDIMHCMRSKNYLGFGVAVAVVYGVSTDGSTEDVP
jgi:hypothetical protein